MNQIVPDKIEKRVEVLEKEQNALQKSQQETMTLVNGNALSIQSLLIKTENTSKQASDNAKRISKQDEIIVKLSKTDWTTILTVVGLVCSLIGSFVYIQLEPLKKDIEAKTSTDRRQYDFHNQNTEKISALKSDVEKAKSMNERSREEISFIRSENIKLREKIIRIEVKDEINKELEEKKLRRNK